MDFRNDNLYHLVFTKLKGSSLLDIGCGSGGLVHLAGERGLQALGLEPDKRAVELSKKLYGPLDIIIGNACYGTKLGRRFDNRTMLDVLKHLEDDVTQIRLNGHLLNDGGAVRRSSTGFPFPLRFKGCKSKASQEIYKERIGRQVGGEQFQSNGDPILEHDRTFTISNL